VRELLEGLSLASVRWIITLDVTADAEEFYGKPPSEWDWDELLRTGESCGVH